MAPKNRYGRRAPARKGKKGIPARKTAVAKAVKSNSDKKIAKVVNNVLAKKVETKLRQDAGGLVVRSIQNTMTQLQFDAQVFMLTPQQNTGLPISCAYPVIGNGIGQDQAIGDEFSIKATYINYIVNALPYSASSNPSPKSQIVQVFVIQPKTGQRLGLTVANIQSSNVANWYENQTDAESGMTGSLFDKLRKVDRDNYKVIAYREHKIGWAGSLNTSNSAATLQNNDFKQFASGKIKIAAYNNKYDRLGYSQRVPMYLFVQVMAADGTVNPLTTLPVEFRFNSSIYYTDM